MIALKRLIYKSFCCLDKCTSSEPDNGKNLEANEEQSDVKRAEFMLREAMEDDEAGDIESAVEQYMEAVELCLKAVIKH